MVGHIHKFVSVGTWETGSDDNDSGQTLTAENFKVEIGVSLILRGSR